MRESLLNLKVNLDKKIQNSNTRIIIKFKPKKCINIFLFDIFPRNLEILE